MFPLRIRLWMFLAIAAAIILYLYADMLIRANMAYAL